MSEFLHFKGSWRSYQKRILDNLEYHLLDKKLHIVAAPGAGKTTLGIEVIARLNQPTLILAPTNTIRYQWRDRICSAFLEEKDYGIVSVDIRKPAYITVITYQALLAAFCGGNDVEKDSVSEEEVNEDSIISSGRFNSDKADEVIKILKKAKITLLCFDEAHHLRKEWWKALMYLNDNLKPNQTLSLTATPPYDVDVSEWNRYSELCGEIDESISIPELVKNGDLCPHQDFIYLSGLRDSEKEIIKKHNHNVDKMIQRLSSDTRLQRFLSSLDVFTDADNNVEKIYEDSKFYVSVVSFLHSNNYEISKEFLKLFDAKVSEIPPFDSKQARNLLNGIIYTHSEEFAKLEGKVDEYLNLAKHLGLIHNKKIFLSDNINIQRQIAHSLGKLDSIKDIVGYEYSNLGSKLRMVILADYIKANDIGNTTLGVVPIWRTLKDRYSGDLISLGVLCGTLILIPKSKMDAFNKLLEEENMPLDSVSICEYNEDFEFIKITPMESAKNKIVALVTQMFNNGDITVLVGTQALLGEGWDAPCINSLILSSTVSSYMLSNQMRGRAIRIDKNNPNKVSNIWHLASVIMPKGSGIYETVFKKTTTDEDEEEEKASIYYDLNQLKRRFEGFEAPSHFGKHEIVNGISRVLSIASVTSAIGQYGDSIIPKINYSVVRLASDRQQTFNWWKEALYSGYNAPEMMLKTGVEAPKMTMRTLKYTSYRSIIIAIIVFFLAPFIYEPRLFVLLSGNVGRFIISLWVIGFLGAMGYILYKYVRTGTVAGVMKQIGIVMLETLSYQGHIMTSLNNIGVSVNNEEEELIISCKNLPADENNLFIKCLQEFLDPIENPRYLLIKKNRLANSIKQEDYFAIPAIFSSNKTSVKIFEELWKKYIGNCEIIYTRSKEGRRILLKARKSAFSSLKRERSKKISKWQ